MLKRNPALAAQEAIHNLLARRGRTEGSEIIALNESIARICDETCRIDRQNVHSRQETLRRLIKARGLTREKLQELAGISSGTLDNVMKEEFRCSKQVAFRLMIVLCADENEMRELYRLFGYAPLAHAAADRVVSWCVKNQSFQKLYTQLGGARDNGAAVFWALLLSLTRAYGGTLSGEFGTLEKTLKDFGEEGGDADDEA